MVPSVPEEPDEREESAKDGETRGVQTRDRHVKQVRSEKGEAKVVSRFRVASVTGRYGREPCCRKRIQLSTIEKATFFVVGLTHP